MKPPALEQKAIFVRDAPTHLVGRKITGITVSNVVRVTDLEINRGQRKQIAISNYSTEPMLLYASQGGQPIAEIAARTSWTMATDADLWIGGTTATTLTALVSETFYK